MAEGPPWRFIITDLNGAILTFLDRLASARSVNFELNKATTATGTVPSDNPQINIIWPVADGGDDDPFLTFNSRQLIGFRRENTDPQYPWVPRFAGLVMTVQDEAGSDQPYSTYTAYDPWQVLYSRPVLNPGHTDDDGPMLPGKAGYLSEPGETGDAFIIRMLMDQYNWQVFKGNPYPEAFLDWGQSGFYNGTIETTLPLTPADSNQHFKIDSGMSLGEAFDQVCSSGNMDIVITPIYDPLQRPGMLGELNIYTRAGIETGVSFEWDEPEYSTSAINRLADGTQMANVVQFYQGRKSPVDVIVEPTSIAKYGEYWAQQFFPGQPDNAPIEAIAAAQLVMRRNGLTRITVDPTPEIATFPFTGYYLGDLVTINSTSALRQATSVMQRIYGIPVNIADNALEQITQLLVGPRDEAIFDGPSTSSFASNETANFAAGKSSKGTNFTTNP